MIDGIIKGTGNSRFLKGAGWPNSYAEFKAMAEAGALPFDLNGINEAGWQQLATALNKANLLSDDTAGKLGGAETVNAALSLLGRFQSGLCNEYVWEKYTWDEIRTPTTDHLTITSENTVIVSYSGTLLYGENGIEGLDAPQTISIACSSAGANDMNANVAGKYFTLPSADTIYFMGAGSQASYYIDQVRIIEGSADIVTATQNIFNYVNAPLPTAYPPVVSDGFLYKSLGQIGTATTGPKEVSGTFRTASTTQTFDVGFKPMIVCFVSGSGSLSLFLGAMNSEYLKVSGSASCQIALTNSGFTVGSTTVLGTEITYTAMSWEGK